MCRQNLREHRTEALYPKKKERVLSSLLSPGVTLEVKGFAAGLPEDLRGVHDVFLQEQTVGLQGVLQ